MTEKNRDKILSLEAVVDLNTIKYSFNIWKLYFPNTVFIFLCIQLALNVLQFIGIN